MESKDNYQVNININQVEFDQLATMLLSEKELNRSAFIRRLIRQEWARRHGNEGNARDSREEDLRNGRFWFD